MRPAKYFTMPGSSAASPIVSASREIAPAGVFNSCETFVTKSRRIISKRRCSLISEMKIAKRSSEIWPTRTCRYSVSEGRNLPASMPLPSVFFAAARAARSSGIDNSRSRTTLSVDTNRRISRISASVIALSSTMPKRCAPGETYVTDASESTTINASGMTAISWRSVDCTGTRGPNSDMFFCAPNRLGSFGSISSSLNCTPRARPSKKATTATATTTIAITTCSSVIR